MRLLPFLAVALVVVVTPGVDMALVTKNALIHGRTAALATALGVNSGIVLWTVAAAVGLAAVVHASAATFAVIKIAGAVYLVYLGLQALRAGRQRAGVNVPSRAGPLATAAAFRQGFVSNALNPKIAVFFTSLMPQFVVHGSSTLLDLLALGALFTVIGVVWLTAYALAVSRGGTFLRQPGVKRVMDYLSGVVLVGLGVRLALERRA